jgi:signal transduction histidine kinase
VAGGCTFMTQPAGFAEPAGNRPTATGADAGPQAGASSAQPPAGIFPANADRLRLLAELAPALGHDIHNMLSVVLSSSELARRLCQPAATELFDAIAIATRNAADLTRILMQLSGGHAMPAADSLLDLNRRLQTLLPMLDRILPPGSSLHVQLTNAASWLVRVAAAEFDSAILNLVSNARDALRAGGVQGGRVIVRVRNVIRCGPDGAAAEHVLVSVADTGCGMDKATLARVWEPFFTTKGPNGTGLGLFQVRRFAEAAGGMARIHSAPGRGTIAHLWLPRDRAVAGAGATISQTASQTADQAGTTTESDRIHNKKQGGWIQ